VPRAAAARRRHVVCAHIGPISWHNWARDRRSGFRELNVYTTYYHLREKPFALTPDPRFLFLSLSHREALAHVLYGVEQGEGFIAVTGEVGTGKTTLCRTLLERLGNRTEVAFIFNPTLTGEELLRAISIEYGLPEANRSRAELNDQLNRFLLDMKRAGRRVVLVVDEAQNLATETLEEVRLLSNLETSTSKLIQIVLFGQPELDETLDSPQLRQLRQRITAHQRALAPVAALGCRGRRVHSPPRAHRGGGGSRSLHERRAARDPPPRARGPSPRQHSRRPLVAGRIRRRCRADRSRPRGPGRP
jgi:type II secretory pathway predicted ATPase ExeA